MPVPSPRLEIRRPTFGEVIPRAEVRGYPLELELSGFVPARDGQGVLVALDGERPRRWVPETPLRLSDLLPENESLSPGAHVLLGVLVDAEGRVLRGQGPNGQSPFFVLDFAVGERVTLPPPQSARVFCLAPAGTFYGKEHEALRLELLTTGSSPGPARLRVEAESGGVDWASPLEPTRPHVLSGLPLGDVRFAAVLANGSRAVCEATLNPELSGGR
jgi:hypothetical protein